VIIKAEIVFNQRGEPKDNPRFVVTNQRQSPKFIYKKAYCSRGEIENRIKELHHGLEFDRTSCPRFWANQFRVLLTAAAYALMQEIRRQARRTTLARAQVTTLREHLFKLSARIEESVRRIVVHLPHFFPYATEWTSIARQLGAAPG
jgi:Transposase DDE domain group 1